MSKQRRRGKPGVAKTATAELSRQLREMTPDDIKAEILKCGSQLEQAGQAVKIMLDDIDTLAAAGGHVARLQLAKAVIAAVIALKALDRMRAKEQEREGD